MWGGIEISTTEGPAYAITDTRRRRREARSRGMIPPAGASRGQSFSFPAVDLRYSTSLAHHEAIHAMADDLDLAIDELIVVNSYIFCTHGHEYCNHCSMDTRIANDYKNEGQEVVGMLSQEMIRQAHLGMDTEVRDNISYSSCPPTNLDHSNTSANPSPSPAASSKPPERPPPELPSTSAKTTTKPTAPNASTGRSSSARRTRVITRKRRARSTIASAS